MHYEILTFEEVESLKKEYASLTSRVDAMRRKLALEMKLRDAARSFSRLKPAHDQHEGQKYEDELATSNRNCEDLTQALSKLERRTQNVHRQLLEHTAGVLQMTHKGLKKGPKKNMVRTPESVYSSNTRGSVYDFDERSLYKTSDHLDLFGTPDKRATAANQGAGTLVAIDSIQNTERRLEELSNRMHEMMLQVKIDEDLGHVPPPSTDGEPANPAMYIEAHLAYIERGLNALNTGRGESSIGDAEEQLRDINARFHNVLAQSGLPLSPTISPPPHLSDGGFDKQLSYLRAGIENLQSRIEDLLEQKSILKTQIQQQRELNSKSDAERDAHLTEIVEQLAGARQELELSERRGDAVRKELALAMEQLDALCNERQQDEQQSEHADSDALASEREARVRVEEENARLDALIQQSREEAKIQHEEVETVRAHAESEIARLQTIIEELHSQANAKAEEASEACERAEQALSELEISMEQTRADAEARVEEATALRAQAEETALRAEANLSQLQAALERTRSDAEARVEEAITLRTQAEENAARLQAELTELESEIVRAQTELTVVKAELDGAYGTRAERAAEVAANPVIQKEMDFLNRRNRELAEELEAFKTNSAGSGGLQQRVEMLEKELRETIDDYEAITKASIEYEKEREAFESNIDSLRERCEQLETQLYEERINCMGVNSTASPARDGAPTSTTTVFLKNEFKKMMRDMRAENMKILKAEQEERRRLELLVRSTKRVQSNKSSLSQRSVVG